MLHCLSQKVTEIQKIQKMQKNLPPAMSQRTLGLLGLTKRKSKKVSFFAEGCKQWAKHAVSWKIASVWVKTERYWVASRRSDGSEPLPFGRGFRRRHRVGSVTD